MDFYIILFKDKNTKNFKFIVIFKKSIYFSPKEN